MATAASTPEVSSVPVPAPAIAPAWDHMVWLPCTLKVELTVPHLTVGDILRLELESVVETRWQQNADVPIRANGQLIAWAEFEGVDERLAVRVTRLA